MGEAQELHRRIIQYWGVTVGAGGSADLRSTGDERHLMANDTMHIPGTAVTLFDFGVQGVWFADVSRPARILANC